jgi:potassium-transporting ATPase KdpC subunit
VNGEFGLYPLAVTGWSQVFFHDRAAGQLIQSGGKIVGSRIIGQALVGSGYSHSRLSAPGAGYDPASSSGSNLGPTNKTLMARVDADVHRLRQENSTAAIPIDLVTSSGSGLDPDISSCCRGI